MQVVRRLSSAPQRLCLLLTCSISCAPVCPSCRQLATEPDGHSQRDRSRRYFGAPTLRAERSAQLKRWRRSLQEGAAAAAATGGGSDGSAALGLLAMRKAPGQTQQAQQAQQGRRLDLPSPSFLPLEIEQDAGAAGAAAPGPAMSAAAELAAEQAAARRQQGETNEELLLRRTRQFTEATRERPHDIQLWLRFARFQVGRGHLAMASSSALCTLPGEVVVPGARAWAGWGWDAGPVALQIKLPPPPFVTFPLCPAALPPAPPQLSIPPSLHSPHTFAGRGAAAGPAASRRRARRR